ncbi:MAG TPA: cytochrome c biogenesis protein CcsA [Deltaproteobacteria bacterium]|jgi:ABC-type transport system involved in cytochrome c biogenesis permease subunit|nr:cytochrome c biogenesis protein CcsA [Deltaproteobacteria bacterium]
MSLAVVTFFYILAGAAFITYLFWRKPSVILAARALFAASIASHLLFIISLAWQGDHLPLLSPVQAANMMIFLSSLVFVVFAFRKATAVLGAFFLPAASFCLGLIAPSLQADQGAPLAAARIWYPLHTLTVIGGEALFAVAFVASVVYLLHDSVIRKGRIHSTASHLPPLKILDRILSACLSFGFVAITAGMIFGTLWASSLSVSFAHLTTKASAGAVTWLVFAFSLHQRFAIGWAGRRTAIITIIGFILMILLFVTLNVLFPDAHGIGLTQ